MKTKHIWNIWAIIFLFQLNIVAQIPENKEKNNQPVYQLEEFHQRAGLKNLFHKIDASRYVRIAYLGGSITAAADGWRDLTFSWFRLNYPRTIFLQTNAGIGGTGSDLGAFRVEQEVLEENPDLLFIEFAVNDAARSREEVIRSMEGIVRKVRKHNPYTDICFVYTITETQGQLLLEGKMHATVLAMEELAGHYEIPSIHMGIGVAKLFAEDKLLFAAPESENATKIVFTTDKVHPLSTSGHPLYAATVIKYLDKMSTGKKLSANAFPTPLMNDNWQNAKMIAIDQVNKEGNWTKIPADHPSLKSFMHQLPNIYMGTPKSKLTFRFKGTTLGIYDIIGPGTGNIKVRIDDKERIVGRFDKYCTYWRLANGILFDQLENTVHEVEIEVLEAGLDKRTMLTDANEEKYLKQQADYKDENFYIGQLLMVGELVH